MRNVFPWSTGRAVKVCHIWGGGGVPPSTFSCIGGGVIGEETMEPGGKQSGGVKKLAYLMEGVSICSNWLNFQTFGEQTRGWGGDLTGGGGEGTDCRKFGCGGAWERRPESLLTIGQPGKSSVLGKKTHWKKYKGKKPFATDRDMVLLKMGLITL